MALLILIGISMKMMNSSNKFLYDLDFNNAMIKIERNESEDSVVIQTRSQLIICCEYSSFITVNGEKYEMENPYNTLMDVIKKKI